jgi:REP element-mobilizing transposase RayT
LFEAAEKEMFVKMLMKQVRFSGLELLGYCVMSNHVHLLLRVSPVTALSDAELLKRYGEYYENSKAPQSTVSLSELRSILAKGGSDAADARQRILARMGDLPAFMRELKQRFTIWYNHKHNNQGTIWAARYKSLIVEDTAECLTKVAAYIDLNPVRAEIVDDPKDYRWCCYAAAAAGRRVERAAISQLFQGLQDGELCMRSYRLILYGKGYLSKGLTGKDQGRIRKETLEAVIANQGNIELHRLLHLRIRYFIDGTVLGSRDFVETLFHENRHLFGAKRQRGSSELKLDAWSHLHVMRNLKTRIYG